MASYISEILSLVFLALVPSIAQVIDHYPQVSDIELLSSSEYEVLLTITNEDLSTFCVIFEIDEANIDLDSTFSAEVDCSDYSNDIMAFDSDTDSTSTRINSISGSSGIDMTRNSESFVISWNELSSTNTTIAADDIQTFTITSDVYPLYTTFVQLADGIFAINFEFATSNVYDIYMVTSNVNLSLSLSDIKTFEENGFMTIPGYDDPDFVGLFIFGASIDDTAGLYDLNLTWIADAGNIEFDSRSNFGYLWGYSATFEIYDVDEDAISLFRYGVTGDDSHASSYCVYFGSFLLSAICFVWYI